MKFAFAYQFVVLGILFAGFSEASHNCTSFSDRFHGFGCEVTYAEFKDGKSEIKMISSDSNKTEADIMWFQVRLSKLQAFPKGIFETFNNLERVMIMDCTGVPTLNTSFFDKKISLILFKNTDLEVIGEEAFVGLSNVTTLSLNNNKIRKVHKDSFKDLISLEKIEMNSNDIESLDDDTFANNWKLQHVMMLNNKIKIITAQLFSRNPLLLSIELKNNEITQIEKDFNANLTKLERADFTSNLCVSENFVIARGRTWDYYNARFEKCNENYAMMKQNNEAVKRIEEENESFGLKISEGLDKITSAMKHFEDKMKNSTSVEEMKKEILQFIEVDKENVKRELSESLKNVSIQAKKLLAEDVKRGVVERLNQGDNQTHNAQIREDFKSLKEEFSNKFANIFWAMFAIFVMVSVVSIYAAYKVKDQPILWYQSHASSDGQSDSMVSQIFWDNGGSINYFRRVHASSSHPQYFDVFKYAIKIYKLN